MIVSRSFAALRLVVWRTLKLEEVGGKLVKRVGVSANYLTVAISPGPKIEGGQRWK